MLQVIWFHEQKHLFTVIFMAPFWKGIHNQIFHYFTHFDSILISSVISTKSGFEWKNFEETQLQWKMQWNVTDSDFANLICHADL